MTPTTRAEQAIATRQLLIDRGMAVFPVKGYAATSPADIIEGTGLSRALWYHYFGDMGAFFLAVTDARTTPRGEWWLAFEDPAIDSLEAAIERALSGFERADPLYSGWVVAFIEFIQLHRDDAAIRARAERQYRGYVEELGNFVEVLQRRGLATTGKPPREIGAAILALREGRLTHQAVYGADTGSDLDLVVALLRA